MFITFKKWTALYVATILALFAIFAAILWQGNAVNASKNLELKQSGEFILIIDPGHGGFDPGAVASDGTAESGINLAVGLQMEEMARLLGVETDMTRREDVSTESDASAAVRQRKNSDLKNRVALVEDTPDAILISVHQNHFTDSRYSGAQVFFQRGDANRQWGESAQQVLQEGLDPANGRKAKPMPDGIYLFDHITCPAILVECGFLSNGEEAALLCTDAYQRRVAVALAGAYFAGVELFPATRGGT